MRITTTANLGLLVRERRRELRLSQQTLATEAQVSRRWLSDMENGKSSAEMGLVLRVIAALGLTVDVGTATPQPGAIDLDEVIREHTGPPERAVNDDR